MRGLYSIPLRGLKEGSHLFDFNIDSKLFANYEKSEIHEAALTATVTVLRHSSHIEMKIVISGTVSLTCDRCLELYTQEVSTDDSVLVKFGDQWEEVDDEVLIMPGGENEFMLDQLFYEFAHLGLPLKKVHPDDENGRSTCNPEMLEKLNQHMVKESKGKNGPYVEEFAKLKNINNQN
ncbi:MAG: DUF177 domain-containing protein [Bacteroidales bacterium]|jgi:uncharacterized metal-binding protein YceD (DUF177 family)|nr:DUF177 domain-containing protein [Bacteroidales bacterium]